MPQEKLLSRKISSWIQGWMVRSAENDPDGAMAMYLWLWQSTGKQPGPTLIPRSIRFGCMASFDLISLGGWYVRARVLRLARSVVKNGEALSRISRAAVLVLALGVAVPLQVSGQDQTDQVVIGSWEGKLSIPDGTQLTIVFTVERGEDGGLNGTLESPDQAAIVIPLSSATFDDGRLILVASSVPGSPMFTGTPSEDGTALSGTFSQGGGQLPLELMKKN